jgi:uncharacterized SAM-binding protein YcdF (DUF218 family)
MLWFLFLLASFALAARAIRLRKTSTRAGRWVRLVMTLVCLGLAVVFWPGRFFVEKMLTELAMPLGCVWFALVLTALVLIVRGGRWLTTTVLVLACASLSLAGNYAVSNRLIRSLETPYLGVDPLDEAPFEVICVLGGGAWIDREGRPAISPAGDRIIVAARLYRAQKAPILLCTGGDIRPAPNLPTMAEMSRGVLMDLGVPRDDILLTGGDTTKTELAAIRRHIDENGWKRVGVVTSAWHMPRVERLARAAGITLVPLPADYQTSAKRELPLWTELRRASAIPNVGALEQSHMGVKEYLAAVASR